MISARPSSSLRLLARNDARRRLLAALNARLSTAEIAANALEPRTVLVERSAITSVWHNSPRGARLFHTKTRRSRRIPNSVRLERRRRPIGCACLMSVSSSLDTNGVREALRSYILFSFAPLREKTCTNSTDKQAVRGKPPLPPQRKRGRISDPFPLLACFRLFCLAYSSC